jgi:hypothetical protein
MNTRKRPSPPSDDNYEPNQRQKTTKAARTTRGATHKAKTAEELLSEPKNTIFDPKTDLLVSLASLMQHKLQLINLAVFTLQARSTKSN